LDGRSGVSRSAILFRSARNPRTEPTLRGGGNLMRTFLKSLVALGAVAVFLFVAPAARAQQCPDTVSHRHGLGGSWSGLPEANLGGQAAAFHAQSINNGAALFLCKSSADSVGGQCQPEAGTSSDGVVTANGNWADVGSTGCPVNTGIALDGDAPVV